MKRATIRDVAKIAGVSRTTVSNIINDVNRCTEVTKERVRQVMKELNYQPNMTARNLAIQKSSLIGVVIPNYCSNGLVMDNPFYIEFLSGAKYALHFEVKKKEYEIIICNLQSEDQVREWIIKNNLDGVILFGAYCKEFYEQLKKLEIPIVLIDNYDEYGEPFHQIKINDRQSGYMATRYLIRQGHKKIAFVTGPLSNVDVHRERLLGYQDALMERGLKIKTDYILVESICFESGINAGRKLLRLKERGVTAAFLTADILAFGMLKFFYLNRVKIPEQFSVIGFDNVKSSEYINPGLSTLDQNIFEKGKIASKIITDHISNSTQTSVIVELAVQLKIRQSTARNYS